MTIGISPASAASWQGLADSGHGLCDSQYYPLAHSFFWIEQKLWGDSSWVIPSQYSPASLGAVVLLQILRRLSKFRAHGWPRHYLLCILSKLNRRLISELKNTLWFIFFCSILTYLNFDERSNRLAYISSSLFLSWLLCKTAIGLCRQ